jgi:hypothetical protein
MKATRSIHDEVHGALICASFVIAGSTAKPNIATSSLVA